ncbi:hypothetical protein BH10PSE7_BH10PSE7_37300 [soil metagenome]
MLVSPAYIWRATPVARVLAAFALTAGLGGAPARAEDPITNFANEFYSYFPAAPDLKAPDFDFVPFWTDDLKKAQKAYRKGDFERAKRFFEKSSEDGNIVADWYLGHMYRLGRGVNRDEAKAFSYYSRVADAFDGEERDQNRLRIMLDALVRVADYYRTGNKAARIKVNPERSLRIYRLASTYGHPGAQYALGAMNLSGEGVRQSPDQALRWLMTSARKRYAPAEALLGDLYWKGDVVERDRTRAIMWYILAKETTRPADSPGVYDRLDDMLAQSTEEERLEAEARATVWSDRYPADTSGPPPD